MRSKLAIILLIVFFANPLAAQELTGTLHQIKKSGQIRIGYRVISDLYRSKKILEIYDKWIGDFTRQRLPAFDAMIQLNATPE